MNAMCIDKQTDSPIGLPKLASLSAYGFILAFWVTIIGRCGITQLDIHKVKDSCIYMVVLFNKEIGFHTTTNLTGLSALGSIFERFLGNRCQVVRKSYSWLNTMGEYLHSYIEFRTLMVRTCTDLSTKR